MYPSVSSSAPVHARTTALIVPTSTPIFSREWRSSCPTYMDLAPCDARVNLSHPNSCPFESSDAFVPSGRNTRLCDDELLQANPPRKLSSFMSNSLSEDRWPIASRNEHSTWQRLPGRRHLDRNLAALRHHGLLLAHRSHEIRL